MTAPLRWKEQGSEASAELRALMKYAQGRVPDAAQAAALTEAVLSQLPPSVPPPLGVGALASGKLIALASLTLLGAALGVSFYTTGPAASHRAPPALPSLPPPAAVQALPHDEEAPPELLPAISATPQRKLLPARAVLRSKVPVDNANREQRELELLHAARLARRTSPEAALALLREHEHSFPDSKFREEREALLIEQLERVDPAAAAARRAQFEQRYPQSAYRRVIGK
jgi:hypothetical protein